MRKVVSNTTPLIGLADINEIKPLVEKLQETGFYVSPKVKQYVLEEANELVNRG